MTRTLLSCAFACCVALTPACARKSAPAGAGADAGQGVTVESLSHQFGNAVEGDYLEHTFVVSNNGPADVAVAQVQPNCPCVTAQLSQQRIPAGGKAEVKVRFDTLDRTGDQDRKVTLVFADASLQPIDLRLHAQVQPAIALQEDEEDDEEAEDTFVGADVTREFKVIGGRAAGAHISVVEVTHPNVTATVADDPSAGGKVVRALIRAPERGHFHAQIVLSTDVERKPRVVENIDWSVKGNVTIAPVAAHFEVDGPAGALQPEERSIVVKSRLPGFVVRSAKSQSAAFTAQLAPGKEAGTFEVRIRPSDPKAASALTTSFVELRTNDKVEPVVRVPIAVAPRRTASARAAASRHP